LLLSSCRDRLPLDLLLAATRCLRVSATMSKHRKNLSWILFMLLGLWIIQLAAVHGLDNGVALTPPYDRA
jgi:threonine/homoserine efflux transporter RhtA